MSESEGIPRFDRIRCRHCGRRVHADATICPHCGHDPRSFAFPSILTLVILFALGTALALLLWYNARLVLLAFDQQPTLIAAPPTVTATWTPRVVVVVLTETPNPEPAATDSPTAIPSATFTTLPTLTPTRAVTRPRATNTSTLTPTATFGPPLTLFTPDDGEKFYGPRKQIALTWEAVTNLPVNQWYRAHVEFTDRSNQVVSWCGWTQQGQIQFPSNYYDDSSPNDRAFRWDVRLWQTDSAPRDAGCNFSATPLSAPGATRTFFWY